MNGMQETIMLENILSYMHWRIATNFVYMDGYSICLPEKHSILNSLPKAWM